jgi:hypothetical protein
MLLAAPVSADVRAAPTTHYSPPTFIMPHHISSPLYARSVGLNSCSTDQECQEPKKRCCPPRFIRSCSALLFLLDSALMGGTIVDQLRYPLSTSSHHPWYFAPTTSSVLFGSNNKIVKQNKHFVIPHSWMTTRW